MNDVPASLRWGAWVVAGVVLLVLYRPSVVGHWDELLVPSAGIATYLASTAVWAVTGVLLLLGRLGRGTARVMVAVVLVAAVVATVVVPVAEQRTALGWSVGSSGWLVLMLSLDSPAARLATWLAVPHAASLAAVLTVEPSAGEVTGVLARAVGILGPQLLFGLAGGQLRRTAAAAATLEREEQEVRTASEVAASLHADRLQRAHHVSEIVRPVLDELAQLPEGSRTGGGLRHRCAVAGARVRRLLAAWHSPGEDALAAELDACVEELQRLGLRVELHVRGPRDVTVPAELRRAACDVVLTTAGHARQQVRITALTTRDELRVSVLADTPTPGADALVGGGDTMVGGGRSDSGGDHASATAAGAPATLRTTVHDLPDALWVEAACQLT